MNISRLIFSILAIAFGVFFFVYGGYDDSPGAQLLGALIFIVAVVSVVRRKKKDSGRPTS